MLDQFRFPINLMEGRDVVRRAFGPNKRSYARDLWQSDSRVQLPPAGLVVVARGESLVVAAYVIGGLIDWLLSTGL